MQTVFTDGGRPEEWNHNTRDCVVRAIVIATCLPYGTVYSALLRANIKFRSTRKCKYARWLQEADVNALPRNGVIRPVWKPYIESLGWVWTPTMGIGTGCRVHLRADELPGGNLICRLSKHLTAVKDGVAYDTFDHSRGGTRCVYGYFKKGEK